MDVRKSWYAYATIKRAKLKNVRAYFAPSEV